MAAIAFASPYWISSRLTVIGGTVTNASAVCVKMWDADWNEEVSTVYEKTVDWIEQVISVMTVQTQLGESPQRQ